MQATLGNNKKSPINNLTSYLKKNKQNPKLVEGKIIIKIIAEINEIRTEKQ